MGEIEPAQGRVTITFRGTCTHFHGVIPGIPHRVVMPNGNAMRFGSVAFAGNKEPQAWSIPPHTASIAIMETPSPGEHTRGVIKVIKIPRPTHFRIVNAIDPIHYDDSFCEKIHSLRDFVNHFQYSAEVVLRGRAAAYFDVTNGEISSGCDGNAALVTVTTATAGKPQLDMTLLSSDDGTPVEAKPIELPLFATVLVNNIGHDCDKAEGFDFLLHFLTGVGGIPTDLLKMPPGWKAEADPNAPLRRLAELGHPHLRDPDEERKKIIEIVNMHASCSDSRYP